MDLIIVAIRYSDRNREQVNIASVYGRTCGGALLTPQARTEGKQGGRERSSMHARTSGGMKSVSEFHSELDNPRRVLRVRDHAEVCPADVTLRLAQNDRVRHIECFGAELERLGFRAEAFNMPNTV